MGATVSIFDISKRKNLEKLVFNGSFEVPLTVINVMKRACKRALSYSDPIAVRLAIERDIGLTSEKIMVDWLEYNSAPAFRAALFQFADTVANPLKVIKPTVKVVNEKEILEFIDNKRNNNDNSSNSNNIDLNIENIDKVILSEEEYSEWDKNIKGVLVFLGTTPCLDMYTNASVNIGSTQDAFNRIYDCMKAGTDAGWFPDGSCYACTMDWLHDCALKEAHKRNCPCHWCRGWEVHHGKVEYCNGIRSKFIPSTVDVNYKNKNYFLEDKMRLNKKNDKSYNGWNNYNHNNFNNYNNFRGNRGNRGGYRGGYRNNRGNRGGYNNNYNNRNYNNYDKNFNNNFDKKEDKNENKDKK